MHAASGAESAAATYNERFGRARCAIASLVAPREARGVLRQPLEERIGSRKEGGVGARPPMGFARWLLDDHSRSASQAAPGTFHTGGSEGSAGHRSAGAASTGRDRRGRAGAASTGWVGGLGVGRRAVPGPKSLSVTGTPRLFHVKRPSEAARHGRLYGRRADRDRREACPRATSADWPRCQPRGLRGARSLDELATKEPPSPPKSHGPSGGARIPDAAFAHERLIGPRCPCLVGGRECASSTNCPALRAQRAPLAAEVGWKGRGGQALWFEGRGPSSSCAGLRNVLRGPKNDEAPENPGLRRLRSGL